MPALSAVRVSDVMEPACIISKETPIAAALQLMREKNTDLFSVVDEKGRLIGALSEANLIQLVKHEPPAGRIDPVWFDEVGHEAGTQPVEAIMMTNITTITPDDHAGTAVKVMNAAGYRLLHVVDADQTLLGIVRMRAIVERLVEG